MHAKQVPEPSGKFIVVPIWPLWAQTATHWATLPILIPLDFTLLYSYCNLKMFIHCCEGMHDVCVCV